MAAKSRGSWDSTDKRTKAGRDNGSYHPHRDTDAFLGAIGLGDKKKSASKAPPKNKSQKEIQAEMEREAARAAEDARIRAEEKARRKAEEERKQKILTEISEVSFNNDTDHNISAINNLFDVYAQNKSTAIRKSAIRKVDNGIQKLTQIGAESEAALYNQKLKKLKHLELLPLYVAGGGILIILISLIMGNASSAKTRDSGLILLFVGLITIGVGIFRYFRKTP